MKNIKLLKLITGEEVIAEVINDHERTDIYTLYKPYCITLVPKENRITIILQYWLSLSCDHSIVINKNCIIFVILPN